MQRGIDMADQGHATRRTQDIGVRRWRIADRRRSRPRSLFEIVARARLAPGVVVWARVPFDDRDEDKIRPAVVIHVKGRRVTVRPLTSAESRVSCRLEEVEDLTSAGLQRASGFRRWSVVVDIADIVDVAGELGARDRTVAVDGAVVRRRPIKSEAA